MEQPTCDSSNTLSNAQTGDGIMSNANEPKSPNKGFAKRLSEWNRPKGLPKGWRRRIIKSTMPLVMEKELIQQGRQEVVDFIGRDAFEHNYSMYGHQTHDCFACKYEAKIKEWGIKEVKDGH